MRPPKETLIALFSTSLSAPVTLNKPAAFVGTAFSFAVKTSGADFRASIVTFS